MPIKTDYSGLTDTERKGVQFAIDAAQSKETVDEYLARLQPDQRAIDSYVETMKAADKQAWSVATDFAFELSSESRAKLFSVIVELGTAEGKDLTPLKPLIEKLQG